MNNVGVSINELEKEGKLKQMGLAPGGDETHGGVREPERLRVRHGLWRCLNCGTELSAQESDACELEECEAINALWRLCGGKENDEKGVPSLDHCYSLLLDRMLHIDSALGDIVADAPHSCERVAGAECGLFSRWCEVDTDEAGEVDEQEGGLKRTRREHGRWYEDRLPGGISRTGFGPAVPSSPLIQATSCLHSSTFEHSCGLSRLHHRHWVRSAFILLSGLAQFSGIREKRA